MKKRTLELSISELSPGGDGVSICTIDGERRAVFVHGTAPGDRARAEVDLSQRPARGRLLALLEPSSSRTTPPCRHVERCGGCNWMFLAPSAQQREHAQMVSRLLDDVPVKSHPAARELGYRTRARVHAEGRRGRVVVGMFARRSHEPAKVDTCCVLDPVLDRVRGDLGDWLAGSSGRGEAQLGLGRPDEQPRKAVVDVRWRGELAPAVFGRLERAVQANAIAGARVFAGEVRKPAVIGDPTPWVRAADGAPLKLAPGGFSQATEEGNVVLAQRVDELARALAPGPCVELFAGAGNLTVLLARSRDVVAVERDPEACAAARANVAARHLTTKIVEADANAWPLPKGLDLVVLDPPRDGARAVALELAARARRGRAPAIVYVACDPPTLARDVHTLTEAGYTVREVETFEMFPHTSHVETVVVLVPPGRSQAGGSGAGPR